MNINNLPFEIDLLPADAKAFVIRLAQDGHISDWDEAFDESLGINEAMYFTIYLYGGAKRPPITRS